MTVQADRESVSLGIKARRVFADLEIRKGRKPEFQVGTSFKF